MLNFELSPQAILNYSILNCELEMNTKSKWKIKTQRLKVKTQKLEHKNLNTKLEHKNLNTKLEHKNLNTKLEYKT